MFNCPTLETKHLLSPITNIELIVIQGDILASRTKCESDNVAHHKFNQQAPDNPPKSQG